MDILFGELGSDKGDLLNGGLEDAVNVIPRQIDYAPFRNPQAIAGSLSATCVGATATRDITGVAYTFAATPTKLYRRSSTVWNDVSRTSTSYTNSDDVRWRFETFGNELLAVNGVDAMQVYTLGTSALFANQSASASAPVASCIAVVRDFVMVGGVSTGKNRVQWCQINNARRWNLSVQHQADFQDLPGGGAIIVNITGGDFATILTEDGLWRATYVGSPLIFRFDLVAPGVRCDAAGSVARYQNLTYFYSPQGFQAFDGQNAIPIGNEKIDEFFAADYRSAYKYKVSSVIDPINKLYIISYPSVNNAVGTCDRMLIYNWAVGRWARVVQSVEMLFNSISLGYTLEELDAVSSSIDLLSVTLDSAVWIGGAPMGGAFTVNHCLSSFTGDFKTATFITGESQLIPNARAFVRAIRPLIQGDSATSITAQIGKRDTLTESVSYTSASVINTSGICPVRANARYHRVRIDVERGFERAMGFDIDFVKDGVR